MEDACMQQRIEQSVYEGVMRREGWIQFSHYWEVSKGVLANGLDWQHGCSDSG